MKLISTHKVKGVESCSLSDAISYLKEQPVLGLDTETTGLNFLDNELLLIQIGDQTHQFVIDPRGLDISSLNQILSNKNIVKVLHNAKFDVKFLKAAGFTVENIYDTMLVEKLLNNGKFQIKGANKLNSLIKRYLKIDLDKTQQTSFIGHRGDFSLSQLQYAADDVKYLLNLRARQDHFITKFNLNNVVALENEVCLCFADIEFNGILLDKTAWRENIAQAAIERDSMLKVLDAHILENPLFYNYASRGVQIDLLTPVEDMRRVAFNWASPKQVLDLFQKILPDLESVGAEELANIKSEHPLLEQYLTYKKYDKLVGSFGEKFLGLCYSDGKIHTNFNQIMLTGRVSSSRPNMQQLPATNKYRNCFIPDTKDWVFVSSDFSSQELCIIAHGSQDPVWLDALEKGQDLHSVCAELVYGDKWKDAAQKDCWFYIAHTNDETGIVFKQNGKDKCSCKAHKDLRNKVKAVNFGLAYGMGPYTLASRLDISEEEAQELIETYFKTFPSIQKFLSSLASSGMSQGYITTYPPYTRRRWFPDWSEMLTDRKKIASIERESKNTPIQGTGADCTKEALIRCRKYIQKTGAPVKIFMTVHDQIDTLCHRDYLETWKKDFIQIMERAALTIIPSGNLKADLTISDAWAK